MNGEASRRRAGSAPGLERAIILTLLAADCEEEGWTSERLGAELGAGAGEIEAAVRGLLADGVLAGESARVFASRAARRLDELGLIAI